MKTEDFILGSIKNFLKPGFSTVDGSEFSKNGLISEDFLEKFRDYEPRYKKPFQSNLRNAQYLDLMHYKLPRCLKYIDRASMRSIESEFFFRS